MASHHKEMSKTKDKTKDMEKIMVTAVVVTYNRKALLEKVIRSLLAQTVEIGRIIIVNNGPTDGTGEWLAAEYGNDPRFDVVTQENVGGSGGFYRGIQEASKEKCDWIWCMDDDVFPRENCLETLLNVAERHEKLGIVCPHRLMSGKTFVGEAKTLNLTNPLSDMHNDMLTAQEVENNETVSIVGMAFEGPLIRNTAYFGHRYGKNIWVRHFAAMPFLLHMYAAITFNFVKGHKYSFSDYGLFWKMMRRGVREDLGKM